MRNILVEITCKHCFYHTHIKSHTLVMADLEPALKQRIFTNTMFTYQCPRCGCEITFLHNFLYRDSHHQFLIYMSQETKDLQELKDQFPMYQIRFVYHPQQLLETIRILEDGLDDRIIKVLKERLKQRYPSSATVTYQDSDEQRNLWFQYTCEDDYDMKGIPYASYQSIQEEFATKLSQDTSWEIEE